MKMFISLLFCNVYRRHTLFPVFRPTILPRLRIKSIQETEFGMFLASLQFCKKMPKVMPRVGVESVTRNYILRFAKVNP